MTKPAVFKGLPPLSAAKLRRPRTTAPLIIRPRLLDALTGGLNRALTLVSAPAGYGKTTIVSQWLDSVHLPWVWLSLDERDSNLPTFLSYLVAAVRTIYPDAGQTCELLLRAPNLPSPDRLAVSLLNDLDDLPGPLLFVLDDYHMIQSLDVHAVMARLVQHMPPSIHLVLTTRADPPLPLERLRGRGALVEIRGADLRFSTEETGQLVRLTLGPAATEETAALLEESTEGWVVGLQLAAISMRGHSDPGAFARTIAQNSTQLVIDYLMAEVLQGLPDAQRDFLLHTSILDRFCAPLYNAIRDENSPNSTGDELLAAIRRANLFLVPLDDEGGWFRYHHLFRYLLRNRLKQTYRAAEINGMHARAGVWFAAHGMTDEAIAHSLLAGDTQAAAELVEDQVHPSLDREEWRQVERRIALLPAEISTRPRLQVARAWLNFIRYRFEAITELLDAAEVALAHNTPAVASAPLHGEIAALRAAIANNNNDAHETVRLAETAMSHLQADTQYVTGMANFFFINGLQATGRSTEAIAFAHNKLDYYGQWPTVSLRILLALCNVYYELADVPGMQGAVTTFRQLARRAGLGLSLAWTSYGQGWLHYQRNELAAAEASFLDLAGIAPIAHGRALLDGFTGLALTRLALGRPDEALADVGRLREHLLEREMTVLLPVAESLQQHVLLLATAPDANPYYTAPGLPLSIEFWEQPELTQVRTLLASGTPAAFGKATELLARCRAKATTRFARRSLIEIEALQARVCLAQGDEAAALETLQRAVELAEPGGALRQLADGGVELAVLLEKLAAASVAPNYVRQVLAVLKGQVVFPHQAHPTPTPGSDGPKAIPSIETLTNREVDILILLAQRLSDKEIAERLFLAPGTVKKHTNHLYRKLGVHNRREAAAAARRLGLV